MLIGHRLQKGRPGSGAKKNADKTPKKTDATSKKGKKASTTESKKSGRILNDSLGGAEERKRQDLAGNV